MPIFKLSQKKDKSDKVVAGIRLTESDYVNPNTAKIDLKEVRGTKTGFTAEDLGSQEEDVVETLAMPKVPPVQVIEEADDSLMEQTSVAIPPAMTPPPKEKPAGIPPISAAPMNAPTEPPKSPTYTAPPPLKPLTPDPTLGTGATPPQKAEDDTVEIGVLKKKDATKPPTPETSKPEEEQNEDKPEVAVVPPLDAPKKIKLTPPSELKKPDYDQEPETETTPPEELAQLPPPTYEETSKADKETDAAEPPKTDDAADQEKGKAVSPDAEGKDDKPQSPMRMKKTPFGKAPMGKKPLGVFGKKPMGKKPLGAFGKKPLSSFGKKPLSAIGKKPIPPGMKSSAADADKAPQKDEIKPPVEEKTDALASEAKVETPSTAEKLPEVPKLTPPTSPSDEKTEDGKLKLPTPGATPTPIVADDGTSELKLPPVVGVPTLKPPTVDESSKDKSSPEKAEEETAEPEMKEKPVAVTPVESPKKLKLTTAIDLKAKPDFDKEPETIVSAPKPEDEPVIGGAKPLTEEESIKRPDILPKLTTKHIDPKDIEIKAPPVPTLKPPVADKPEAGLKPKSPMGMKRPVGKQPMGKKPLGVFGKKPMGEKPLGAFGKKPLGAFGKKPLGAFGKKPLSAFGKKPLSALGKKPIPPGAKPESPEDKPPVDEKTPDIFDAPKKDDIPTIKPPIGAKPGATDGVPILKPPASAPIPGAPGMKPPTPTAPVAPAAELKPPAPEEKPNTLGDLGVPKPAPQEARTMMMPAVGAPPPKGKVTEIEPGDELEGPTNVIPAYEKVESPTQIEERKRSTASLFCFFKIVGKWQKKHYLSTDHGIRIGGADSLNEITLNDNDINKLQVVIVEVADQWLAIDAGPKDMMRVDGLPSRQVTLTPNLPFVLLIGSEPIIALLSNTGDTPELIQPDTPPPGGAPQICKVKFGEKEFPVPIPVGLPEGESKEITSLPKPAFTLTPLHDPDEVLQKLKIPGDSQGLHLGRSSKLSELLAIDKNISRKHAKLVPQGKNLIVEDCDTSNGTYVNSEEITGPTPVRAGEIITFGSISFIVSFE